MTVVNTPANDTDKAKQENEAARANQQDVDIKNLQEQAEKDRAVEREVSAEEQKDIKSDEDRFNERRQQMQERQAARQPKVAPTLEDRKKQMDEQQKRQADIDEERRVIEFNHRVEIEYWQKLQSIFINGIECAVRRVAASGGQLKVRTHRGEVGADGGDFIVTLPDGEVCVMSTEAVRLFDKASGAQHVGVDGEIILAPIDYAPEDDQADQASDEAGTGGAETIDYIDKSAVDHDSATGPVASTEAERDQKRYRTSSVNQGTAQHVDEGHMATAQTTSAQNMTAPRKMAGLQDQAGPGAPVNQGRQAGPEPPQKSRIAEKDQSTQKK